MQEVINIIISNGVFAMLFVGLLFYQLKDSSQREKKYIETIEKLSKHIDIIENVKENVFEIKNILIIKKSKKEQKNEV